MKGLLYKEWLQLWREAVLLTLVAAGCWIAAPLVHHHTVSPILLMVSFLLTLSVGMVSIQLDAQGQWSVFVRTLPVSGRTVMTAYYLSAVLSGMAGLLGTVLSAAALGQFLPLYAGKSLLLAEAGLSLLFLFEALALPLALRFPKQQLLVPLAFGFLIQPAMHPERVLSFLGRHPAAVLLCAAASFTVLLLSWALVCRRAGRHRS